MLVGPTSQGQTTAILRPSPRACSTRERSRPESGLETPSETPSENASEESAADSKGTGAVRSCQTRAAATSRLRTCYTQQIGAVSPPPHAPSPRASSSATMSYHQGARGTRSRADAAPCPADATSNTVPTLQESQHLREEPQDSLLTAREGCKPETLLQAHTRLDTRNDHAQGKAPSPLAARPERCPPATPCAPRE